MNDAKLRNAAKNWDTMAKVCCGLFCAAGIVCFIFAALVLIFGNRMYEAGSFTLDLDFIKLYLAEKYQMANGLIRVFTVIALVGVGAICMLVSYGLKQLREILAPMKEGRPFAENIPGKLRNIAWTILSGGVILQIVAFVERMTLTKAYPMEEIFSSSAIDRIEYSFTVDFGFVFVACIVLFLSHIFNYGQKLQQESDETL